MRHKSRKKRNIQQWCPCDYDDKALPNRLKLCNIRVAQPRKCALQITPCAASTAYAMPAHCMQFCTAGSKGLWNMQVRDKMHLCTLYRHGRCCQEAWNRQACNCRSTHWHCGTAHHSQCHADRRHEDALWHMLIWSIKPCCQLYTRLGVLFQKKWQLLHHGKHCCGCTAGFFNDAAALKLTKQCLASKMHVAWVKTWYEEHAFLARTATQPRTVFSHQLLAPKACKFKAKV